jgi:hypothetical protein
MVVASKDLWSLAIGPPAIEPKDLTAAIEDQVTRGDLDYRSRVLIRDSVKALRNYWGEIRTEEWLRLSPFGEEIEAICRGPFDEDRGFPSLMRRVMDVTKPEQIKRFLSDLGRQVRQPLRVSIGGSAALILGGYLVRRTEDIYVVNELPEEIRTQPAMLNHLKEVHDLELAHFQSHYLPAGWEQRVHALAAFDKLQVSLVDVYDVFLSKLFSARTKDKSDLIVLLPQLDKEALVSKLKEHTQSMLSAAGLREKAENNWFILFGEALPA